MTGDNLSPAEIVGRLIETGDVKARAGIADMLIRGALAGAVLSFAVTLALLFEYQTHIPLSGAVVFPVGICMIILLGMDLVTGNFGFVPLSWLQGRTTTRIMLLNWFWVYVGNFLGALAYGGLFWVALTNAGHDSPGLMGESLRETAIAKTLVYKQAGAAGLLTVFVKGLLCNWMICLGVAMAASSVSTFGRIAACWLPIFAFFALGFEHCVVSEFAIPLGMALGAPVSVGDWWLWNQIPSTLGNLIGGFLFTMGALYATHRPGKAQQDPVRPDQASS